MAGGKIPLKTNASSAILRARSVQIRRVPAQPVTPVSSYLAQRVGQPAQLAALQTQLHGLVMLVMVLAQNAQAL
jgi:hypothetical protein